MKKANTEKMKTNSAINVMPTVPHVPDQMILTAQTVKQDTLLFHKKMEMLNVPNVTHSVPPVLVQLLMIVLHVMPNKTESLKEPPVLQKMDLNKIQMMPKTHSLTKHANQMNTE